MGSFHPEGICEGCCPIESIIRISIVPGKFIRGPWPDGVVPHRHCQGSLANEVVNLRAEGSYGKQMKIGGNFGFTGLSCTSGLIFASRRFFVHFYCVFLSLPRPPPPPFVAHRSGRWTGRDGPRGGPPAAPPPPRGAPPAAGGRRGPYNCGRVITPPGDGVTDGFSIPE